MIKVEDGYIDLRGNNEELLLDMARVLVTMKKMCFEDDIVPEYNHWLFKAILMSEDCSIKDIETLDTNKVLRELSKALEWENEQETTDSKIESWKMFISNQEEEEDDERYE